MQTKSQESESTLLRILEDTLISDSHSPENTKSAVTGLKPTRPRYYEDKARITVGGKRYRVGNENHPYNAVYKLGGFPAVYMAMGLVERTKKNWEALKKTVHKQFIKVEPGEVYVLSNPAWPGWHKIGMSTDVHTRLSNYQTGSPLRDYKVEYSVAVYDKYDAEACVHKKLAKHTCQLNEWFEAPLDYAITMCKLLRCSKEAK